MSLKNRNPKLSKRLELLIFGYIEQSTKSLSIFSDNNIPSSVIDIIFQYIDRSKDKWSNMNANNNWKSQITYYRANNYNNQVCTLFGDHVVKPNEIYTWRIQLHKYTNNFYIGVIKNKKKILEQWSTKSVTEHGTSRPYIFDCDNGKIMLKLN